MQINLNSINKIHLKDLIISYAHFNTLLSLKEKFENTTNREREKKGILILKNDLIGESVDILYENSGRPYLIDEKKFISISHSKTLVAMGYGNYRIGIDVEEVDYRVLRVRNKFLNDKEKNLFDELDITANTIAWAIKESLYKLNKENGIDFKSELLILNENFPHKSYNCLMKEDGKFKEVKVEIIKIENLILAFNVKD